MNEDRNYSQTLNLDHVGAAYLSLSPDKSSRSSTSRSGSHNPDSPSTDTSLISGSPFIPLYAAVKRQYESRLLFRNQPDALKSVLGHADQTANLRPGWVFRFSSPEDEDYLMIEGEIRGMAEKLLVGVSTA